MPYCCLHKSHIVVVLRSCSDTITDICGGCSFFPGIHGMVQGLRRWSTGCSQHKLRPCGSRCQPVDTKPRWRSECKIWGNERIFQKPQWRPCKWKKLDRFLKKVSKFFLLQRHSVACSQHAQFSLEKDYWSYKLIHSLHFSLHLSLSLSLSLSAFVHIRTARKLLEIFLEKKYHV